VFRCEGELIRSAAARGGLRGSGAALMEQLQAPRLPTGDRPEGCTVLTRTVQHIIDVDSDDRGEIGEAVRWEIWRCRHVRR
jgi:hypothetical protein